MQKAFISDDKSVTTEKLKKAIEKTKSISITLKEKIDALKNIYEKFDFQKANEG
jgi:hypothetical protein